MSDRLTLDLARGCLTRDEEPIHLRPQSYEVLKLLLENRNRLMSKDALIERVWQGRAVTDGSLVKCIEEVREALGPGAQQWLRTVRGRGYVFDPPAAPAVNVTAVAETKEPVSVAPGRRSSRRWWGYLAAAVMTSILALLIWRTRPPGNPGPAPTIRSLAVLPLENLSGDPSQDYFAEGMTDALITDLAQISDLRVISRTSTSRYKGVSRPIGDIARELGVDGIVEGTVTRSAGRVRIDSQLIYAPRDQHLWARSYERDVSDILSLQGEIAQAIAREVRAVVTPQQRSRLNAAVTSNPASYDAYLRGRYYWNQRTARGATRSITFFEDAVQKDPKFALAFAGLANAYNFTNVLGVVSPKESAPRAKAAALTALQLDQHLAEAHAALGLVYSHFDFDLPAAQREFLKAIELNPNDADAHLFYAGGYLTPMGRHDEAIAHMKRALELDPVSLPLNNMMAETYRWAEESEKALDQFQRTIAIDPTFPLAHFMFAELLEDGGRLEEAIREVERGRLVAGVPPDQATGWANTLRSELSSRGPRGYWQKNLARIVEAQKRGGTNYMEAFQVAKAYARADDRKNALKWLQKSYEEREGQEITLLRWAPEFAGMREEAQFVSLLDRMGLPH